MLINAHSSAGSKMTLKNKVVLGYYFDSKPQVETQNNTIIWVYGVLDTFVIPFNKHMM